MRSKYSTDPMPHTDENVAEEFQISRENQNLFAYRSQQKAKHAMENGRLKNEIVEIVKVDIEIRKGQTQIISMGEHPRHDTVIDDLQKLHSIVKPNGTITAGNSSGVNDGAAALLLASPFAIKEHNLSTIARVVAGTSAGVAPRIMGYGPVPAINKLFPLAISLLMIFQFWS